MFPFQRALPALLPAPLLACSTSEPDCSRFEIPLSPPPSWHAVFLYNPEALSCLLALQDDKAPEPGLACLP